MRIGLDLGLLQTRFDSKSTLEEVERCTHLSNTAVVASHVVEGHGLTELVVLAKLLRLFQQIQRTVNVFLLQVVHGKDITNLAELLAGAGELG